MTDKLDMALDDIIEQSKKKSTPRGTTFKSRGTVRKYRGRGGANAPRGGRNSVRTERKVRRAPVLDTRLKRKKDTPVRRRGGLNRRPATLRAKSVQAPQSSNPYRGPSTTTNPKLFLSNLGYRVTQNDIIELFSQIGPLKSARVNYDINGRSLGTGEVMYEVPAHAALAERRYNGILIDSQPLVIEKSGPSSHTNTSTKLSSGITVIRNPLTT
eukprot:g5386.t1